MYAFHVMTPFNFPFSTCEKCVANANNKSNMQPWSTLINGISTIILIIAMFVGKSIPVKVALGSFALFEAWHTFSHLKHVGTHQANVVHVICDALCKKVATDI